MVRSEVQAPHPIEESGGFVGRKAQVRLAQFGQLTTRAQASQGQGRVGAGSDDQMQLRQQMVEQKGKSVVDRLSRDEVIIVENEGKSFRHRGNLVDRSRQERLDCKWLGGLQGRDDRLADVLVDSLCGRDEIGQEVGWIIIALIQRQPGDGWAEARNQVFRKKPGF